MKAPEKKSKKPFSVDSVPSPARMGTTTRKTIDVPWIVTSSL